MFKCDSTVYKHLSQFVREVKLTQHPRVDDLLSSIHEIQHEVILRS